MPFFIIGGNGYGYVQCRQTYTKLNTKQKLMNIEKLKYEAQNKALHIADVSECLLVFEIDENGHQCFMRITKDVSDGKDYAGFRVINEETFYLKPEQIVFLAGWLNAR